MPNAAPKTPQSDAREIKKFVGQLEQPAMWSRYNLFGFFASLVVLSIAHKFVLYLYELDDSHTHEDLGQFTRFCLVIIIVATWSRFLLVEVDHRVNELLEQVNKEDGRKNFADLTRDDLPHINPKNYTDAQLSEIKKICTTMDQLLPGKTLGKCIKFFGNASLLYCVSDYLLHDYGTDDIRSSLGETSIFYSVGILLAAIQSAALICLVPADLLGVVFGKLLLSLCAFLKVIEYASEFVTFLKDNIHRRLINRLQANRLDANAVSLPPDMFTQLSILLRGQHDLSFSSRFLKENTKNLERNLATVLCSIGYNNHLVNITLYVSLFSGHPIIVFNCGGLLPNLIGKLRESFVDKVLFSMGMTDQHYKFYIEGDKLKLLIKSVHFVNSLPGRVKNLAQQSISSVDSVESSYAVASNTTDSRRRGLSRRPNQRKGVNADVAPPIAPERAVRPSQDDSQECFEFTAARNLKLTIAGLVVLVLKEHFDTFKQEGINDEVMALRLLTSLAHGIRRPGSIRKGCNWVDRHERRQGNPIAPSESRAFKFKDRGAERLVVVENNQEHNSYTSTKVYSH